jgi:hypothetical protein
MSANRVPEEEGNRMLRTLSTVRSFPPTFDRKSSIEAYPVTVVPTSCAPDFASLRNVAGAKYAS